MCGRARMASRPSAGLVQSLARPRRQPTSSLPSSSSSTTSSHSCTEQNAISEIKIKSVNEANLAIIDESKITRKENVCPGMYAYVIIALGKDNRKLQCRCMRWGLCRSWETSLSSPWRVFNARCEGVLLKPIFKQLMPIRRCVVTLDGFYEFKKLENGKKQPYYLFSNDVGDNNMLVAGLYDTWVDESLLSEGCTEDEATRYTVTLLTMDSSSNISWLHDRQPCIMDLDTARLWLDHSCSTEDVLSNMRAACRTPNLSWHPVSNKINNIKYQGKDCSTHIDERSGAITSFFGRQPKKSVRSPSNIMSSSMLSIATKNKSSSSTKSPRKRCIATSEAKIVIMNGDLKKVKNKQCSHNFSASSISLKNTKKRQRNMITSFFQSSPRKKKKGSPDGQQEI